MMEEAHRFLLYLNPFPGYRKNTGTTCSTSVLVISLCTNQSLETVQGALAQFPANSTCFPPCLWVQLLFSSRLTHFQSAHNEQCQNLLTSAKWVDIALARGAEPKKKNPTPLSSMECCFSFLFCIPSSHTHQPVTLPHLTSLSHFTFHTHSSHSLLCVYLLL